LFGKPPSAAPFSALASPLAFIVGSGRFGECRGTRVPFKNESIMKYIVLGKDGNEYGPVDAETLKKWVEHGRVQKDSQIRNAMVRKWNDAGKLDFLQDSFAVQETVAEQEEASGILGALGLKAKKEEPEKTKEKSTAFKYRHVPDPAGPALRLMSGLTDVLVLAIFAGFLFLLMNISAGTLSLGEFTTGWEDELKKAEKAVEDPYGDAGKEALKEAEAKKNAGDESADSDSNDTSEAGDDETAVPKKEEGPPAWTTVPKENVERLNSLYSKFFALFALGAFLYFGIGLGVFAQTLGMWYWGLIIVKGYDGESYPARSFAFAIAMLLMGFLSPIITLVNPQRKSIHEYLTGARLIKVSGKPK